MSCSKIFPHLIGHYHEKQFPDVRPESGGINRMTIKTEGAEFKQYLTSSSALVVGAKLSNEGGARAPAGRDFRKDPILVATKSNFHLLS